MHPEHLIFTDVLQSEEPGYPPSGWYEIFGDTGKSALIWSLCSWRQKQNKRLTLLLELAEPYSYLPVCRWADIPYESLIILRSHSSIFTDAVKLIEKSGLEIGQVIVENLGFLLGSGRQSEAVESFLGPPSTLFELNRLSKERDIAIFSTSYEVNRFDIPGVRQNPLGGSMLVNLTKEQRIHIVRTNFLQKGGVHIGERIRVTNMLDTKERTCEVDIKYNYGPVVSRRRDVVCLPVEA